MSTMSIRLPNSLHRRLREIAKREGVSMNQLISSAVGEKVAALMNVDYLEERAKRGSRRKYEAVLGKVADREPDEFDRLPDSSHRQKPSSAKGKRRRRAQINCEYTGQKRRGGDFQMFWNYVLSCGLNVLGPRTSSRWWRRWCPTRSGSQRR